MDKKALSRLKMAIARLSEEELRALDLEGAWESKPDHKKVQESSVSVEHKAQTEAAVMESENRIRESLMRFVQDMKLEEQEKLQAPPEGSAEHQLPSMAAEEEKNDIQPSAIRRSPELPDRFSAGSEAAFLPKTEQKDSEPFRQSSVQQEPFVQLPLRMPVELYMKLSELAKSRGISPEEYVLSCVKKNSI